MKPLTTGRTFPSVCCTASQIFTFFGFNSGNQKISDTIEVKSLASNKKKWSQIDLSSTDDYFSKKFVVLNPINENEILVLSEGSNLIYEVNEHRFTRQDNRQEFGRAVCQRVLPSGAIAFVAHDLCGDLLWTFSATG